VILIDTTPLVALCDARDAKHRIARKHLELLAANAFAVCDAVLTEACFHLPYQSQRQRLQALLQSMEIDPLPVTNERTFWIEVFDWLVKYSDHDPDWADGCLAVLSGRDKDLKVWTYDREFQTTWRRPNGTVIPIAVKSA
jgi:predicted nucleic acid-binding protein